MYLVTFLSVGHLHGVMPGDRVSFMRGLSLLGVVNHSAATQPALVRELKVCAEQSAGVHGEDAKVPPQPAQVSAQQTYVV